VTADETLLRLQEWYAAHCDGDWEHQWGVKIDTLDNPGWSLTVDLFETEFEKVPFTRFSVEHPTDWMFFELRDCQFIGRCGPLKLGEMIQVFLDWAEKSAPKP
jgi:hypothetical protein